MSTAVQESRSRAPKLARFGGTIRESGDGAFGFGSAGGKLDEIAQNIMNGSTKVSMFYAWDRSCGWGDVALGLGLFRGATRPVITEQDLGEGFSAYVVIDAHKNGGCKGVIEQAPFLSLGTKLRQVVTLPKGSYEVLKEASGTSSRGCSLQLFYPAAALSRSRYSPSQLEQRRSPALPVTVVNPWMALPGGHSDNAALAKFCVELAGSVVDVVDDTSGQPLATFGEHGAILTGIVEERRVLKHPVTGARCVAFTFDIWITEPEYVRVVEKAGKYSLDEVVNAEAAIAEGMKVRGWQLSGVGPRIVCYASDALVDRIPAPGKRVTVAANVFARIESLYWDNNYFDEYTGLPKKLIDENLRQEGAFFGIVPAPHTDWRDAAGFGVIRPAKTPRSYFDRK